MQNIFCSEKTQNNKVRPVQALCLDKQCKLNRNICTSCIQKHRHNLNNQLEQFEQHSMIDIHYLIDIMRKETASRQQEYGKFERDTINHFTSIKEKIMEELTKMETQLISILSQIKEKDDVIPIYRELTESQQLNPTRLNVIGGKLSELMEEKKSQDNAEEEIFEFKPLRVDQFGEYQRIQPLLTQMKLSLETIQCKEATSSNFIEYAIRFQQQVQQQMLFSLSSTMESQESRKYEGVLWNAGKIVKKYQGPEYEFEFPQIDVKKAETLDKVVLKIEKTQPKIVQVEQQFDLNNINFNPAPQVLSGHTGTILSVAISDDNRYVASGGCNKLIYIGADGNYEVFLWDLQSKNITKKYKGPEYVCHLSFSRDNKRLAAAGQQVFLYISSSSSYDIYIFDIADLTKNDHIQLLKGHSGDIYRTVFTKNSKNLISGSADRSLRVWDVDGQKEIAKRSCANCVYGVAISNNEELIGCCCHGGLAYLFDSQNLNSLNEKIPPWQAHPDRTNCIEFIQDSQVLLTSGATEIRLWSVQDLLQKKTQHMKEIKSGGGNYIWTVKAYPISNPKVIVACDGKIKIWKLEDAQLKQTIEVQGGLSGDVGYQFVLTSDFKKIITGGKDMNLKIYEKA